MKNQTLQQPLLRWFFSHLRACQSAWNALVRTPIANSIIVLVIAIAITLPLGFFVFLQNFQTANGAWNTSAPTISLYLHTQTPATEINSLLNDLRNNPNIKKVSYISANKGLKTFERNTPFGNITSLFQNNPIPPVIVVTPTGTNQNPVAMQQLFSSLKTMSNVDTAQLDLNWATRLYDIVTIGKNITNTLSILFGFSVLVIIGHTLKHSLTNHTKEISILRLMGATNAYIRRPLLYRGVLYGLLGGIMAWIFVNLFMLQLQSPISALAGTYHTEFQLHVLSFSQGIILLGIASILGFLSAFINVTRFLNKPESVE